MTADLAAGGCAGDPGGGVGGAVARAGFEVPMTGVVPRFTRTPGTIRDVGPDLGEHTEEVLSETIA